MQPAAQAYRADIDGLRAISILLVLLFHGFAEAVPGGYIGVDVFLVISGYLITSQIYMQAKAKNFSFVDFYARRIRRIFPPLVAVLTFVAIYGYLRLNLGDFTALFQHIAAATVFISNFALWQEAGYFDHQSELKPLLHLWSLAIEEQFYVLWPILLGASAMAARRFRNAVIWTLLVVCVTSFAMLIKLAITDPVAAFYSPLARFWELGAGGLLAALQIERKTAGIKLSKRLQDAAATISCLGLVGCAFIFSQQMPLPGLMNALPVLCTLIIVAAGPSAVINRILLASKPMVQLGLVSYSLYLWHWPLLSFMRIEGAGRDSPVLTIVMLIVSALLAFITRTLLEQPIRRSRIRGTPILLVAVFACLGIVGILLSKGQLQPHRLVQQAQIRGQVATAFRELSFDVPNQDCTGIASPESLVFRQYCRAWGRPDAPFTVAVWGDSMAWAWMPAFIALVRDHDWRMLQFMHTGCAPLTGVHRTDGFDGPCRTPELQAQIVDTIRNAKPAVTFVIARWNLYYHGHIKNDILVEKSFITDSPELATPDSARTAFERHLPDTIKQLATVGRVVVFKDSPILKVPVDVGMSTRPDTFEPGRDEHERFEVDINRIIDNAIAPIPNAQAFDPSDRLCNASKCGAYLDGLPAYSDEVHPTPHATLQFVTDILSLGTAPQAAENNVTPPVTQD